MSPHWDSGDTALSTPFLHTCTLKGNFFTNGAVCEMGVEMQVLLWWPLLDVSPPLNPIGLSSSKASVERDCSEY